MTLATECDAVLAATSAASAGAAASRDDIPNKIVLGFKMTTTRNEWAKGIAMQTEFASNAAC